MHLELPYPVRWRSNEDYRAAWDPPPAPDLFRRPAHLGLGVHSRAVVFHQPGGAAVVYEEELFNVVQ